MFNAPYIIRRIPDIAKIYEINEGQIEDLEEGVDQINNDLIADSMSDDVLKHWEAIFELKTYDDESLADRRTKVKGKMLEKLPYSYRVIVRNLDALLPSGYDLYINDDLTYLELRIVLTDKYLLANVTKLLDDMTPLNMVLDIDLAYNTYNILGLHTHNELTAYTYQGLNDEPIM